MAVWIAGDCKFLENGSKDQKILNYWNEVVAPDDDVLLMGEFVKNNIYNPTTYAAIQELNRWLKGHKIIIDYEQERYGPREDLIKNGFGLVQKVYSFVPDATFTVHILPDTEAIEYFKGKMWGAAVRSMTGFTKPFEHNILSLSIEDWGYSPLQYNDLPKLVSNMIIFNKMVEVI